MSYAWTFWTIWQALLKPFAWARFTCNGFRYFVEWITGLALLVDEHTVTGSVTAIDRPQDWRALERFAEYGRWDRVAVTATVTQAVEQAPGRVWYGYRVSAVDDTKVHRNSPNAWGTCTFHEYTARCPNRATTVRAHNWVVCGALLANPGKPAWFLPLSGWLYFRKSQLPVCPEDPETQEVFHTKCELLVDLLREQAGITDGPHLGVFDGAYAVTSVIQPLILPPEESLPHIDFLTRLRHDARLYGPLPQPCRVNQKWGPKRPPPRQGGWWSGPWHTGKAFIYGRQREVRWKEIICFWHVSGPKVPIKVVVAEVEGYTERFTLSTSALKLTGLEMVELFAARFRQEDGFRDLKQRLGWEECRAWTKNPIARTSQALWVTMTLLRLAQFRLEAQRLEKGTWWSAPPWWPTKDRPSVLDVLRLVRNSRTEVLQLLSDWLGIEGRNSAGGSDDTSP
jgi:hypothetical protein